MQGLKGFIQKFYSKWPCLVYDAVTVVLAWYLAYWIRFNLESLPKAVITTESLLSLALIFVLQNACFYGFKVHRGDWRYVSMSDLFRIINASVAGAILVVPPLYWSGLLMHIPRTILPLYSLLLVALLSIGRITYRAYKEHFQTSPFHENDTRVLIIGAGSAGESLIRSLIRDKYYHPIGFIDDKPSKQGSELHGVPVLGGINKLSSIVSLYAIDLIFIAIPSANSSLMRRIVSACEAVEVPFRTLPGLDQLTSGNLALNDLRPVRIEDLLGRDPVELDWQKISQTITGRRVLITGAGGSIGSELCRQVMSLNPESLYLLDNSEFNLYTISNELQTKFPNASIQLSLVSVTDKLGVEAFFRISKPHIVFHAAAYKHVPMLEHQIRTAVINNVLGTQIIAEMSATLGVEKFILISTDKAVNPANIMGTTKRVAEIYCQNLNERVSTEFITVRFGNVLGSAGSVVPLFKQQLAAGGPLTVTHPDIERFFMTIPEASQLILQAMTNGQGGEIFVLDMGEPIKITYLAEQIIRLSGKVPGKDIKVIYTGLRPGEKLYEELFHESEKLIHTTHEKLLKASVRILDWSELNQSLRLIQSACQDNQTEELIILLKSLVPEFEYEYLQENTKA